MEADKALRAGIAALALIGICAALPAADDVAKFDSNMAVRTSVKEDGLKWIDGRELPIEGRAFDDVEHYYDRLPANVTEAVNGGVRNMKHHTAGMQFRFSTTSRRLVFKWVPYSKLPNRDTFPNSGTSGIDVYRYNKRLGRWVFAATGRIAKSEGGVLEVKWWPEDDCLVNLPLYNGIRSFSLGIEEDATVSPLPPRRSGIVKPVVFYGTSITHGACASRPGMSFPNIIGRELDVPIVNLGFSGSGRMELEMSDHVARIDASCYLIDSLANMASMKQKRGNYPFVEDRYEPFIRNLRAKRPDAPIIMCGEPDAWCRKHQMEKYAEELYRKLIAEGWKNLYFIPNDVMLPTDFEGTVEGRHPNDYGMTCLARAYGEAIRKALKMGADGLGEATKVRSGRFRDGVTIGTYILEKPRRTAVYVARIDLTTPGLSFTGTERDPKWGEPIPGADGADTRKTIGTRRETTADFMARRRAEGKNVEIAVNTCGFGPWEAPFNHEYAGFCCWVCADGVEISHKVETFDHPYFIIYRNGKIEIRNGVDFAEKDNIAFAMLGNGLLLKDGRIGYTGIPKDTCGDNVMPRTVLGLTADKRTLVLLVVDGRQPGYSDGARYPELVEILRREGVADAINVDGGGSSSLVVFDRKNNRPRMLNHQPNGEQRKVGMNLGIVFGRK